MNVPGKTQVGKIGATTKGFYYYATVRNSEYNNLDAESWQSYRENTRGKLPSLREILALDFL